MRVRYLHAWDHKCHCWLQWQEQKSRKISHLMCASCNGEYCVRGSSDYLLMGGKIALAAREETKRGDKPRQA